MQYSHVCTPDVVFCAWQLEWEALLTPSFADFKEQAQKWMVGSMRPVSENLSDLPSVRKSFPTVSSIIQMLDIYDKK